MPNDGSASATPARQDYDPLFLNARRELKLTLFVWLAFGIWVVGVSWWQGRAPVVDPDNIPTVLGIPSWVFWGVALPWVAANVFTFWFCFGFMAEDPLEEAAEEEFLQDHPVGGKGDRP